ncbi:MAG: hypothetical protein LBH53_03740, partial [Puniceicoccales bacterium]|nr:hypothetical protein [Puniceicoccales bacterium]
MSLSAEFYRAAADAAARGIGGHDRDRLHGLAVSYGLTAEEERQLPTAIAGLASVRGPARDLRGDAFPPSLPLSAGPSASLSDLRPCWKCFQERTNGLSVEVVSAYQNGIILSRDREELEVFRAIFDRDRYEVNRTSLVPGVGGSNSHKVCRTLLLWGGGAMVVLGIVCGSALGDEFGRNVLGGTFGGMGALVLLIGICMQA